MTKRILFDPEVVIPRGQQHPTLSFWLDLIDWIDATPGARMGRTTYTYFVNHLNDWIAQSGVQQGGLRQLLNRVASAVFEDAEEPRSLAECRHIGGIYAVDDRRDFLVGDLAKQPKFGIDIATVDTNWYQSCGVGKTCRTCRAANVSLVLTRGVPTSRRLGENADGEVPSYPISSCGVCLQDSKGNHYAEDATSGLWWTRDNDGHGGVVFKTYTKGGKSLRFEGDRDVDGNVIDSKHKGPKRAVIPLARLSRCSNPARHVAV